MTMSVPARNFCASLLFVGLSWTSAVSAACPTGAYGPGDGDFVVLTSPDTLAPPAQRYMFRDGRRGSTTDQDALARCEGESVKVAGKDGRAASWPRIAMRETATTFASHGKQLAGNLIEPASAAADAPLVVMVHGSERWSSTHSPYAYALAAQGLRVFAYDKRGTGVSEGEYTQNFELLADDAAAALEHARTMAAGRFGRAGYYGGSQGGWVAPLAATHSHADFVAVGFGLVVSPIDEDREQMLSEANAAGLSDEARADIERLSQATAELVTSNFTEGFEALERLRGEFANKPWARTIRGEYSGEMLRTSDAELRRVGRAIFDNVELIWNYDAVAVLNRLQVPLLWVLAEDDREAPIDTSRRVLSAQVAAGKPIDVYLFPDTDHGMFEYAVQPDGSRKSTRITDGYLKLLADWMKGDVRARYGRGVRLDGAAQH
ncbi:alpha/beta hydrolase family protein [Lysobacter yangpyeongensis]|uniref:Alpha/beta hydrolase family protein n=1 Tax=Lysobacter yangpyeongensis TaxID=346182 RepID=A0ABW0SNQ2_9GAMM